MPHTCTYARSSCSLTLSLPRTLNHPLLSLGLNNPCRIVRESCSLVSLATTLRAQMMTLPRHLSNLFIRHHGQFSLSLTCSLSLSLYIIYFIKYISLQTTWIKCRRPAGVITAQARSWNGSTKGLYPGKLVEERKSSRKRKHAFATRSSPQLSDKHRRRCFSRNRAVSIEQVKLLLVFALSLFLSLPLLCYAENSATNVGQ